MVRVLILLINLVPAFLIAEQSLEVYYSVNAVNNKWNKIGKMYMEIYEGDQVYYPIATNVFHSSWTNILPPYNTETNVTKLTYRDMTHQEKIDLIMTGLIANPVTDELGVIVGYSTVRRENTQARIKILDKVTDKMIKKHLKAQDVNKPDAWIKKNGVEVSGD